jgi:hypothetical protein
MWSATYPIGTTDAPLRRLFHTHSSSVIYRQVMALGTTSSRAILVRKDRASFFDYRVILVQIGIFDEGNAAHYIGNRPSGRSFGLEPFKIRKSKDEAGTL